DVDVFILGAHADAGNREPCPDAVYRGRPVEFTRHAADGLVEVVAEAPDARHQVHWPEPEAAEDGVVEALGAVLHRDAAEGSIRLAEVAIADFRGELDERQGVEVIADKSLPRGVGFIEIHAA